MTSKPTTMVSASSTKVSDSSRPSIPLIFPEANKGLAAGVTWPTAATGVFQFLLS